jgi:hypothetical protein
MNKSDVSIATISWARNEAEENLLKRSLEKLAMLQIPVFITDGGSPASFLSFLQSFPHFTVVETDKKGVFAQAKNSVQAAYAAGTPFIFYTEPDKENFFQNGLPQLLQAVTSTDALGVYLASRSAEGFASFPAFQQMTETTINQCCAEITGQQLDYTYGPFLLNRKTVPYLQQVKDDIGWGWRPFVFVVAHRLGLRLETMAKNFYCPADQQQDDATERLYRMKQLEENIRGIVQAAKLSL